MEYDDVFWRQVRTGDESAVVSAGNLLASSVRDFARALFVPVGDGPTARFEVRHPDVDAWREEAEEIIASGEDVEDRLRARWEHEQGPLTAAFYDSYLRDATTFEVGVSCALRARRRPSCRSARWNDEFSEASHRATKMLGHLDTVLVGDYLNEPRWRGNKLPRIGIEALARYSLFKFADAIGSLAGMVADLDRAKEDRRKQALQRTRLRWKKSRKTCDLRWEQLYQALRADNVLGLNDIQNPEELAQFYDVLRYGLAVYDLAVADQPVTTASAMHVKQITLAAASKPATAQALRPMTTTELAVAVRCSVGTIANWRVGAGVTPKATGDKTAYSVDDVARILLVGSNSALNDECRNRCRMLLSRVEIKTDNGQGEIA